MKLLRIVLIAMIVVVLAAGPLLAAAGGKDKEGPSQGRQIWDTVWRIINFGILVFFLVKYARRPLMAFLRKHGADIGERLENYQAQLAKAKDEYAQTQERLADIQKMIAEIETYMKDEAERARQKIIDQARKNAEHLLDEAKEIASTEVGMARERVKTELVELVITEAEKAIRRDIKPEDDTRLIGDYIGRVTKVADAMT